MDWNIAFSTAQEQGCLLVQPCPGARWCRGLDGERETGQDPSLALSPWPGPCPQLSREDVHAASS